MTDQNLTKLKRLVRDIPEGLLVTSDWLESRGYSGSLRSYYVKAGWLEKPARGVFRRPRGSLKWEQVVVSLQTLLKRPVVVGGRTALELQGHAHFLYYNVPKIHLYGNTPLPDWVNKLPLDQTFILHKNTRLFRNDLVTQRMAGPGRTSMNSENDPCDSEFNMLPWRQEDWPLNVSTLERSILELLNELPNKESFYVADKIIQGLTNLSPRRLQKFLMHCKNVKVKRLFFFFADRHNHAWLKHIDRDSIDLGSGDRMLEPGGRFDPVYRITIPDSFDAN